MGGGDLNLKKSWHPSTLRNIERVWKAEQKHDAEQKKIEQLQKELAEEKAKEEMRQFAENQGVVKRKNDRLDWMYQGPTALVDREQYLMGRRVDTTFEVLEKMENHKDQPFQDSDILQPGAIFGQSSVSVTVDLANKIREDPLFTIRKHEKDQVKNLLTNPVKMKQLRELLQQSMPHKEKDKKKKKKNKKDKKKRRDRDSESSEQEETPPKKSKHSERRERDHELRERDFSQMRSKHSDRRSHLDEQDVKHKSHNRDVFDRKYEGKAYGLIVGERARERINNDLSRRHRSRSPGQKRPSNDVRNKKRTPSPPRRKLTADEMDKRRQQMMDDAKWRTDQCSKNIKRYKEEDEKEASLNNSDNNRKKDSQFYKSLMNKAAEAGSVESRVKQRIYKIQRSRAAMDSNFAKR